MTITPVDKALVPNSILRSAGQRFKLNADKQLQKAEKRLEIVIQRSLGKAVDTLAAVSQAGPKTADHLVKKVSVAEMSMDDLEAASRVYERLIDVSRRQLGLDREETVKPSIQVNVLAAIGSSLDPTVTSGPVLELPAETIADPTEES